MAVSGGGLLSLAIALPAVAGGALLLWPACPVRAARAVGVGASIAVLLVLLGAVLAVPAGELHCRVPWIASAGIHWALGSDGATLPLLLLTAFLQPLAALISASSVREREAAHHGLLLVLEAGMLGVFAARDGFLFYVSWEVTLLPMLFLIGCWGGPDRRRATLAFVLYTMLGSLPMLVALLVLRAAAPVGHATFLFEDLRLAAAALSPAAQAWCWGALVLAFAVKLPLVPLHAWLPLAHVEAPTAGSMLLAGVLLKLGGYGLMQIAGPWFPAAAAAGAPWLAALGVAGILYGSCLALVQDDLKRLVAYSSVAHLGVAALGIATGTPEGYAGALFVMVAHGLGTGTLFACVGVLYARRHSRALADYGGLAGPMPLAATIFVVASLSSVGLPGLAGFVGEFVVLFATFGRWPFLAPLAVCGVVLSAAYMLRAVRLTFFGPPSEGEARDLTLAEAFAVWPAAACLVWLGLAPSALLGPTRAELERLAEPVRAAGALQAAGTAGR
jgi:NADH-quinone oxidoreductase subunit M